MAAVYIHIPFCLKKCNYCAFNSYTKTEFCPDEFVQALKKEIRIWGKENAPFLFPVSSLFLGGVSEETSFLENFIVSIAELFSLATA